MLGESDTLLGRELAGYRLTGIVGNGGMSIVYHGQRMDDTRAETAIKVLRESPIVSGSHATFRSRFYREAETAASLRHSHILPVLEFGEWQGLPYMVMPLATGGTLSMRTASEPGLLALASAADYATQLASALDYAHQHGIVHRDVKPSNALLDGQGRLLLADFGIAQLYKHSIHGNEETTLTSTGEVLGTPCYMAPEQFQVHRVGPAADIYSLGVVLYLLTTGRLPFEGETPLAVGMAHLHAAPLSPRLHRPDLPVPAAAAILAALAKNPRWRFESAGALAQAFTAGLEDRWTVENRERAISLDREVTHLYPVMLGQARSRGAIRPSLRTGLATLAAALLLGGGIVTAQTVQNDGARSAFHSAAISASAPERAVNLAARDNPTKSTPTTSTPTTNKPTGSKPTGGQPLTTVIRYRGSQVYAQQSNGSRLWTVWTDQALVGPPQVRGDLVYLTTVIGSRYTLRAGDGEILSLVTAAVTQNNNDHKHGDKHGKGHGHHGDGGDNGSHGDGGDNGDD